jgi:hypothetical protein
VIPNPVFRLPKTALTPNPSPKKRANVYTHLALTPSIPLSDKRNFHFPLLVGEGRVRWARGKKDQNLTFSPSPKLGRRGRGMRASHVQPI